MHNKVVKINGVKIGVGKKGAQRPRRKHPYHLNFKHLASFTDSTNLKRAIERYNRTVKRYNLNYPLLDNNINIDKFKMVSMLTYEKERGILK